MLLCLKPFVRLFFFNLVQAWSSEIDFLKHYCWTVRGCWLRVVYSLDWAFNETKIVRLFTRWVVVFMCDPTPVVARFFLTINVRLFYQVSPKLNEATTCFNVNIEKYNQISFDVRVRTRNIVPHYFSVSRYFSIAFIIFSCDNLSVRKWLS